MAKSWVAANNDLLQPLKGKKIKPTENNNNKINETKENKRKIKGGKKGKRGGEKKQPQNRFLFFVAVSHAHILLVFITAMWHKLDLTIQQTTSFSKLFVLIT